MVESTALEMRRMGNRTVGSNPTLSARNLTPWSTSRCSQSVGVQGQFAAAERDAPGRVAARLFAGWRRSDSVPRRHAIPLRSINLRNLYSIYPQPFDR